MKVNNLKSKKCSKSQKSVNNINPTRKISFFRIYIKIYT